MFYHNFKYSLKILLRNKGLIFWTFIFPIILGTFFKMAFSNIEKNETLKTIDIAIVDSKTYEEDQIFKETLNTLSNNDTKLFNITVTTKEISKKLLEEEKITGYLEFNPANVDITVSSSGVYETILRYVIDEIYCEKEMLDTLTKQTIEKELANGNQAINPEEIAKQILTTINNSDIKLNDISNKNLSYTITKKGSNAEVRNSGSSEIDKTYIDYFSCSLINGSIMALELKQAIIDSSSNTWGNYYQFEVKLTLK